MRIVYTTSSGMTSVEDVKAHIRLIECRDGLHCIDKGSIYRDIDDKKNAMVFIWQDVTPSDGSVLTEDALKSVEVAKQHHQSTEISKQWWRSLGNGMMWLGRCLYFSIFLSLIFFAFYVTALIGDFAGWW